MPESRLVLVEWVDSSIHPGGWHRDEAALAPGRHVSVGWLTGETKDAIRLVPHRTTEDEPQTYGDIVIPRRAVLAITRLKKRRKKV